jgi:hypothetical protein
MSLVQGWQLACHVAAGLLGLFEGGHDAAVTYVRPCRIVDLRVAVRPIRRGTSWFLAGVCGLFVLIWAVSRTQSDIQSCSVRAHGL